METENTLRVQLAEERWLDARIEYERTNSDESFASEQAYWDAYTEECDRAGICQQAGCLAPVTWHVCCDKHRD